MYHLIPLSGHLKRYNPISAISSDDGYITCQHTVQGQNTLPATDFEYCILFTKIIY